MKFEENKKAKHKDENPKARFRQSCSVFGCKNSFGAPGISFYRFPAAKIHVHRNERRLKWIELVKARNAPNWSPKDYDRICSDHFIGKKKSEDPASPSYNPVIFPDNKNKVKEKSVMNRFKLKKKLSEIRQKNSINSVMEEDNTSDSHEEIQASSYEEIYASSYEDSNFTEPFYKKSIGIQQDFLENRTSDEDLDVNVFICNRFAGDGFMCDAETQVSLQTKKVDKTIVVEEEKKAEQINYLRFKSLKDDQALLDLCGISRNAFLLLNQILSENSCWASEKKRKICIEDRLLMFLTKMKCNFTYKVLGVMFGVNYTTVSRNFQYVLTILTQACKNFIYWPPKELVQETTPECFKPEFSNCRVIIDATEFVVEQPPEAGQRVQFYSNYKKGFRLKIVIGITPSGLICFVSDIFGGRATDPQIVVASTLLDKLDPGDIVLADKGFPQIKTVLDRKGKSVLLVMPPFKSNNTMTASEVEDTYNIASVRIHVERIMQRIRIYRIVEKFTIETLPFCDDILRMCCVLVNLQPPIIKTEFTQ